MVASLCSVLEIKTRHKVAQVFKMNVRIGCATQNLLLDRVVFAHATGSGERNV